jgi:hypothetical protein
MDKALIDVGLAPIQFFRTTIAAPDIAGLPPVECSAESLRASVAVHDTEEDLSLDVLVSNSSPVGIRALSFVVYRGGRPASGGDQRGHEGQALIAGRDHFIVPVPLSIGIDPNGKVAFLLPDRIAIRSALGLDGALLGDPGPAFERWTMDLGSRPQALRLASAFHDLLGATGTAAEALSALDATIRALPTGPDSALLARAMSKLPAPGMLPESRVQALLRSAVRELRENGSIALAEFRQAPNASDANVVRHWMESQATRYDAWAARLPK